MSPLPPTQIATRVKKGKAYKLASADHEELALWQEGIRPGTYYDHNHGLKQTAS